MIGTVAVIGTFDGFDLVDTGIGMVVVIGTFDGCDSVGSGIGTVAMIGTVAVIGTVPNCYYRKERTMTNTGMAYIVVCHTTDQSCVPPSSTNCISIVLLIVTTQNLTGSKNSHCQS